MTHTYAATNFVGTEAVGDPHNPGAALVFTRYIAADETVANIASALSTTADVAARLPVGSLLIIQSVKPGSLASTLYMVTANTGTAITLVSAGLAVSAVAVPYMRTVPMTDGTYELGVPGFAGVVTAIHTAADGAVTTNDAVLTFKVNTTAITGGAVTVASGGAAGDKDSAAPSSNNVITATDRLTVTVSGTPGGSKNAVVTILILP